MLRAESDERLAELAAAGSDAAFEAIVSRHRRSLVRRCARIVGDTDAEEAVQNAMLSAHRALVRGDRVENLGAWLRAIAHNAALNILRARAARPECPDRRLDPVEIHDDPAGRREQLGDLVAAVQSLPQRQRHAIVMRELEGRSYDEIAVRLGATNGAVRQLLNRARATVRDRLAVLPGLEPLTRWLTEGSGGTASVLATGCTVGAKLCASALLPAVIVAGSGASVLPNLPAPQHRTKRAAVVRTTPATTILARAMPPPSPRVTHITPTPQSTATPTNATATTPRPTATNVSSTHTSAPAHRHVATRPSPPVPAHHNRPAQSDPPAPVVHAADCHVTRQPSPDTDRVPASSSEGPPATQQQPLAQQQPPAQEASPEQQQPAPQH